MSKRKLLYTDEELELLLPQNGPFYVYHQNNSGGYYCSPAIVVVIVANNSSEAFAKLVALPGFNSTYCECCGERWDYYENQKTRAEALDELKYYARDDYGMYSSHMKDDKVPLFLIA